MKLSQFKFKLPEEQVALEPTHRAFSNEDGTVDKIYRRDECKLMVIHRKSQKIECLKQDATLVVALVYLYVKIFLIRMATNSI